jgi:hypothetical protein
MFRGLRGEFDEAGGLFAGNGREAFEKFLKGSGAFQMIEQGLDGDTGASEAGGAAQAVRICPDDFVGHRNRIAFAVADGALADVDDLAGANLREGGEEIGEERLEAFELVCADVDDDEAEAELVEGVLLLDAFVDSEENVEVLFGVRQQLLVGDATPS